MNEQLTRLRQLALIEGGRSRRTSLSRAAFTVSVASGKGGVGKSTLTANLAVQLSRFGRRVLLVDADLGLANADLLLGISPERRIDDVLEGRCTLDEVLVRGPGGITLLPAPSGLARLAQVDPPTRFELLRSLSRLVQGYEIVLLDLGSGISDDVVAVAAATDLSLVVLTPEPTALADGYAMVKILASRHAPAIALVPNRVRSPREARRVGIHLGAIAERFLTRKPDVFGWVEEDPGVPAAVDRMLPLLDHAPDGPAARCIRTMARKLLSIGASEPHGQGLVSRLEAAIKGTVST